MGGGRSLWVTATVSCMSMRLYKFCMRLYKFSSFWGGKGEFQGLPPSVWNPDGKYQNESVSYSINVVQVSFGEMIGCDNNDVSMLHVWSNYLKYFNITLTQLPNIFQYFSLWSLQCPIEWFHFQCVGLTSKPKGKWYYARHHVNLFVDLFVFTV